jgi:hypothetical protein
MATLFLHAGHPKTGSSYLQHVLRSNKRALAENGIRYAIGNDAAIAPDATIANGNGAQLFDSRENFSVSLQGNRTSDGSSLLYSSETIFGKFVANDAADYLEDVARLHGYDRVKILIFIRNPVSLFCSVWQQKIKARGGTDIEFADVEENVRHGTRWIFLLQSWLERLERCPAVDLTIHNYSVCADRVLEHFTEWLEIPAGSLDPTTLKRVNRSMSDAELHFMVALNRILGETRILSDPLCEKLTDLRPDAVTPPLEVQQRVWEHVEPAISRINARLPEGSRYQCDIRAPEPRPAALHFSPEQIRVVAESLGNEILRGRRESANRQDEIDRLNREIMDLTEMLEREKNRR